MESTRDRNRRKLTSPQYHCGACKAGDRFSTRTCSKRRLVMRTTSRFLCSLLALLSTPWVALAQQMPPFVALGGVSVPSCAEASDAEYGFSALKPIQIGGGPLYMNARQHRFLDALRGPDGQMLRVVGGIGSGPANLPGFGRTIIDTYTVTYEGHDQPI